MTSILRIDSSTRGTDSVTSLLATELIDKLRTPNSTVVERDLTGPVPLLSVASTAELTVPAGDRSSGAASDLAVADALIEELQAADVIVFAAPIYNFGVPASLKAWADLVARAGTTFGYGETGPVGLLADRPVYIVAASGGTEIGGELDFGTRWLRQFLGFLGFQNVTVIAANHQAIDPQGGLDDARRQLAAVA